MLSALAAAAASTAATSGKGKKPTPINNYLNFSDLGVATYVLALAYLGFSIVSFRRLRHVGKFIRTWTAQRVFYLFIFVQVVLRCLCFALLSAFSISHRKSWYPLLVILYTLPEFVIISVYVLLTFLWLEVYVFSHEQFMVEKDKFHKRWKFYFLAFSVVLYGMLAYFYALIVLKQDGYHENILDLIEYLAAFGCLLVPACFLLIYLYWSQCALVGFPKKNELSWIRIRYINRIVLAWGLGRIVRAIIFFFTISYRWEQRLNTNYLSMLVIGVLTLSEMGPLYYALSWDVIAALILGDGAGEPNSARNPLLGTPRSTTGTYARRNPHSDLENPFDLNSTASTADGTPRRRPRYLAASVRLSELRSRFSLNPSNLHLGESEGDVVRDTGFIVSRRALLVTPEDELEGNPNGRMVFVKGFRLQQADTGAKQVLIDELADDVARYSALEHPHFVRFYGYCAVEQTLFVVSEYMPGMSLDDVLMRSSRPFFPETLLSIAAQIASAMRFYHSLGRGFVHGFLKSSNILLDAGLNVKVGDVGYARLKAYAEIMLVRRMSNAWSAPEVLVHGSKPTQESDVYSFGLLCWQLLTRKMPFVDMELGQIRKLLGATRNQEEGPASLLDFPDERQLTVSPAFVHLVKDCLLYDPDQRPTFEVIVEVLENVV